MLFHDPMLCIVFKNNAQSGEIHTKLFKNKIAFDTEKVRLNDLNYIEILSTKAATVQG